ncbi:MAG: hypothetical protein HYX24_00030 [Candidatus Aenigmarchaeota archaeon]|nr:hypothetical protein [Candidatus Aenigmarchaeota archaeon]
MKAIAIISGVIYLSVIIAATIIAYNSFQPAIKKLQEAGIAQQMEKAMRSIDEKIAAVAGEANGSRRLMTISIQSGKLTVNGSEDTVYWEMISNSQIISPRTGRKIGNIYFGSQLDTKAYEAVYRGIPAYVMENEHLTVFIRKIGNRTSHSQYNTSGIFLNALQKETAGWLDGELSINIDDTNPDNAGKGYTALEETGSSLPYATAIAYLNSTQGSHYIYLTLESGADFLQVRVE